MNEPHLPPEDKAETSPNSPSTHQPQAPKLPPYDDSAPSYGEIVWTQFRKYKLSHWALRGVWAMFLIAVYAPLISLDLPLTMHIAGERTYPWFSDLFNRNYFHSTVDIFFNSLIFLLPVMWGLYRGAQRLINRKATWSKRKKQAIGSRVLWGCGALLLLVNVALYLRPVEHPLSDARTRWDSISAAHDHTINAKDRIAAVPNPDIVGGLAYLEDLETTNKAIAAAESALMSALSDPLRGLDEALTVLRTSPTDDSIQTLSARLSRSLRDLSEAADRLALNADLNAIQASIATAQNTDLPLPERAEAIATALGNAQIINQKIPRSQIAADVLASQTKTQEIAALLSTQKQDARKTRRAAEQSVLSAAKRWTTPSKDRTAAAARAREDFVAYQKTLDTWTAQAASRERLLGALDARVAALSDVDSRLDASAFFPLVRYSFRFPTGDFQKPMPWSEGGAWKHPFGTNNQSKDTFAQMVFGTRIALTIGIVAVAISEILGVILGALAGYFGGRTDSLIMRLVEIMLCFPSLFMIMSLAALIEDRSIFHVMLIIGLTRWTGPARLVRGEFLRLRNMEFVQAAKALGLPEWRIIFQHVLPNALGPVLVSATFGVASAILLESTISFLGVGDPSASTWGKILNEGRIARSEPMILLPGIAIFFIVSLFNLIGEGVRDALDPKMRK